MKIMERKMIKRMIDIIEKINKPGSRLSDDDYSYVMSDKNYILFLILSTMEAALNIEIVSIALKNTMPNCSDRLSDLPGVLRTTACLLKAIVNKNDFFDKKI